MKSDVFVLLDQASWPAFLIDASGRISQANRQAVAVFGSVVQGTGTLLASIWAPGNATKSETFLARLARSPIAAAEIKFLVKGGQSQGFNTQLNPVTLEGERFTLLQLPPAGGSPGSAMANPLVETSLFQKQKLDCALQLARSVALDFNNALTIILGHSSLLLSRCAPDDPARASLIEVERSAERAAEIAADLAAFSRQEKDHQERAAGNLNVLVRQTAELFESRPGPAVSWDIQLEPRLYATHVDEAKVQQALVRVVENAMEALGEAGGTIGLVSRNVDVGDESPEEALRLARGHYVCIEVKDTGTGIPPETLPRIFEPFFTTKTGHRGLGLAWVYGIVTNHSGGVAVASEPGVGTSLRLYFPGSRRILPDGGHRTAELTGHQTVLIVDDEELILTLGQTVLAAYGYRVLTAGSGARALQMLRDSETPIDLVITDMVMPNMSGRELIERVRESAPATRILCSSGYVRPARADEELYLQKPFTAQQLLMKVKQVLAT